MEELRERKGNIYALNCACPGELLPAMFYKWGSSFHFFNFFPIVPALNDDTMLWASDWLYGHLR